VQLIIFDSWGSKLFESTGNLNDASIGWDGQYKGKPQPVGAYVYIVKLTSVSGETTTKKGIINLIR
jgi:gliding motility-associated-like protein